MCTHYQKFCNIAKSLFILTRAIFVCLLTSRLSNLNILLPKYIFQDCVHCSSSRRCAVHDPRFLVLANLFTPRGQRSAFLGQLCCRQYSGNRWQLFTSIDFVMSFVVYYFPYRLRVSVTVVALHIYLFLFHKVLCTQVLSSLCRGYDK